MFTKSSAESKEEYSKLLQKKKQIDEKLNFFETKSSQDYEMSLLHKYNEIKDAAQIMLGAIGNMEGVTVKELHKKYHLPLTD